MVTVLTARTVRPVGTVIRRHAFPDVATKVIALVSSFFQLQKLFQIKASCSTRVARTVGMAAVQTVRLRPKGPIMLDAHHFAVAIGLDRTPIPAILKLNSVNVDRVLVEKSAIVANPVSGAFRKSILDIVDAYVRNVIKIVS